MKKFLKINNKITINKNQNKSELRFIINWFTQNYGSLRTNKLVDNLKKVGFNYSTKAGISLGIEDLLIPNIKKDLLKISEKKLGKLNANEKKGYVNPILYMEKVVQTWDQTNEKLREEIINTFRQTNIINPLYMMTFSGARGNISQIKQLVGMRGLISDSQGEILNIPIKNNFKEGLNLVEYFISCYGARKGLVDTALKTANSGYLTRRLIYSSQNIIIKQPNCKTNYKTLVLVLKSNKNSYKTIKASLLGRILARNIKSLNNEKIIASEGQDICNFILKRVIKTQKIYIRSPLNCIINNGICQLCYGWNLGNGRIAELGESIGIVAAQSIGEPGTQLTMRTFHTGGVFSGETNRIITAPHKGKINYVVKDNHKRIYNKYSEKITVLNKETLISISKNNNQGSIIKLPAKSIIFPKPGKKLSYRQLIAEIPINKTRQQIATESKEIKAPFSGLVVFNRQQNKMSIISCNLLGSKDFYNFYKKKNETKRFSNRKIKTSYSSIQINFKTIKNKIKKVKNKYKHEKKHYSFSIEEIINKNGEFLLTNKRKTEKELIKKTKDIVKIKNFSTEIKTFKNITHKYFFNIIQKNRKTIIVRKATTKLISKNSKIRNEKFVKKLNILFYINHESEKTKDIVQGLPKIEQILEAKRTSNLEKLENNPHEKLKTNFSILENQFNNKIANRIAVIKIQQHLIKKIQDVYESQGISIANKHIEIIVKEMTSRSIIKEKGELKLLSGEIIELNKLEKMNEKIIKKATYEPIILGITKLGLNNQSFITAASFQETSKILTKAAIEGKIDWLNGLKGNVILGKLIPAGTGFNKLIKIY